MRVRLQAGDWLVFDININININILILITMKAAKKQPREEFTIRSDTLYAYMCEYPWRITLFALFASAPLPSNIRTTSFFPSETAK